MHAIEVQGKGRDAIGCVCVRVCASVCVFVGEQESERVVKGVNRSRVQRQGASSGSSEQRRDIITLIDITS